MVSELSIVSKEAKPLFDSLEALELQHLEASARLACFMQSQKRPLFCNLRDGGRAMAQACTLPSVQVEAKSRCIGYLSARVLLNFSARTDHGNRGLFFGQLTKPRSQV